MPGDPSASAAAIPILVALRIYKVLISPLFAGSCRFTPSCSDYAREAIVTYGALRGSLLAMARLARCHPFARAGVDPVPPPAVHSARSRAH